MIPLPLWLFEMLPPVLRGLYVPIIRVPNWHRQRGG